MSWLQQIFGEGGDLNELQMGARAVVVFFMGLVLIRFGGRRSFGMRMPFDNVMTILIGAVLSRAITGSSPFVPVIVSCMVIVALHRFCAWIALYSDFFGTMIKSRSDVLYKDGKLDDKKMKEAMISKKDLMEGVRINANIEDLKEAESIYVERNGQISVVKKEQK